MGEGCGHTHKHTHGTKNAFHTHIYKIHFIQTHTHNVFHTQKHTKHFTHKNIKTNGNVEDRVSNNRLHFGRVVPTVLHVMICLLLINHIDEVIQVLT